MNKLFFIGAVIGVSMLASAPTFASDADIRSELADLAKAQQKKAQVAVESGSILDRNSDLEITAKQSESLFEQLEISTGVIPGEERGGYIVCTSTAISNGNIDIARCRIEKRAPKFLKK